MREFERVERIPTQGPWKTPKETFEFAELFKGMEKGEVFKFPIDEAQSDREQHKLMLREKTRMKSAIKLLDR
ncbi:hypothetical protein DRH27_06175, partial [Candidatus Falkowbacteria bacterium]